MKIIYHCYGGSHSSVLAASLHLGLLPRNRLPTPAEISRLPYYDGQTAKDHGHLRYIGTDEQGHQVFIIGKRNLGKIFGRILKGVAAIFSGGEEIVTVNTMPYVNWLMMVGGFTSRRLGWVRLGRPIVIRGTLHSYYGFLELVNTVKTTISGAGPAPAMETAPREVVFFLDQTGQQAALVAAYLYLDKLGIHPTPENISQVPGFNRPAHGADGHPIQIGSDQYGRMVYTLGAFGETQLVATAIQDLLTLLGLDPTACRIVDAMAPCSRLSRTASYLSRFKLLRQLSGWLAAHSLSRDAGPLVGLSSLLTPPRPGQA